jgi:hypothetical protein
VPYKFLARSDSDVYSKCVLLLLLCTAGCTVEPQLLKCNLNAPFGALTLTAKATKAGTFTNRVEVRSPGGATDTDQADVTVVVPGEETCATWVAKNGCGANNVLNPNKADTLVTSNSTVVNRLLCCVSI